MRNQRAALAAARYKFPKDDSHQNLHTFPDTFVGTRHRLVRVPVDGQACAKAMKERPARGAKSTAPFQVKHHL